MAIPVSKSSEQLAVLFGGEELDCDLNETGKVERVFVRKLPMRLRLKFIELCIDGDGQAIVELCIDKPAGYLDKFTPAAQDALLEKAQALNFQLAEQHLQRMNENSKKLAPLYEKVTKRLIEAGGALLKQWMALSTPPPTPASPSAAPENKSSTKVPTGSPSSSPENPPPTPAAP